MKEQTGEIWRAVLIVLCLFNIFGITSAAVVNSATEDNRHQQKKASTQDGFKIKLSNTDIFSDYGSRFSMPNRMEKSMIPNGRCSMEC